MRRSNQFSGQLRSRFRGKERLSRGESAAGESDDDQDRDLEPSDGDRTAERGPDEKTTEIAAVRLLARREHSRRDLTRKLEGKGHAPETVEHVVNKLAEKQVVSDERFASSFVTHHGRRGQGPVRIRAELRQQGATDEIIEAALARTELDWSEIATAVRVRKFGSTPPRSLAERAKQTRFLQYRGFSADHIRAALSGSTASDVDPELGLADPEWSD